ncbi:hypothetical protein QJQ45_030087 [Haematococcus lacustris]|nr:hypothetical protein QJQ45_030087 [Haematococcus lacustris]
MRTAHKRAAEGETGDPAPSSDEEQQQHFSGKRIAVAAEVFDAVAQLDDGLRDKSKRSYVTQLKHYVRWCESQEPRCDDQDIGNSATLYYIYVVKLHGLIKRLRCKPHPTPAEEQELDQLETGPGSAHLKVSALKQFSVGIINHAGSLDHISFVRHFDICMCPAHALGVYFFQRFSVAQETLCPDNSNSFLQVPLISGHQCLQSMQYDAMNTALRRLFKEHGYDPSSITHAFRKGGAVELAQAGVDSGQLRSHCNWGKLDVAESHYLSTAACMEPVMAMGGWDYTLQNRKSAFWHPRFEIFMTYAWLLIAAKHIFSSLPELQQAAAKLVPSQPPKKQANKQAGFAKKLKACYETVSEAILAITEVLCQDSIWLHLTNPEVSSQHRLCQHMMHCSGYQEVLAFAAKQLLHGELLRRRPRGPMEILNDLYNLQTAAAAGAAAAAAAATAGPGPGPSLQGHRQAGAAAAGLQSPGAGTGSGLQGHRQAGAAAAGLQSPGLGTGPGLDPGLGLQGHWLAGAAAAGQQSSGPGPGPGLEGHCLAEAAAAGLQSPCPSKPCYPYTVEAL